MNEKQGQRWIGQSIHVIFISGGLGKMGFEPRNAGLQSFIVLTATRSCLPDHLDHPPVLPGPHTQTLSLPEISYCDIKLILCNKQPQNASGRQT